MNRYGGAGLWNGSGGNQNFVSELDLGVLSEPTDAATATPERGEMSPARIAKLTITVLAVAGAVGLAWVLRDLFLLLLLSLILAIGLQRPVDWMSRHGARRGVALGIITVLFVGILAAFVSLVVPPVLNEGAALVREAPDYLQRSQQSGVIKELNQRFSLVDKLTALAEKLPDQAVGIGFSVVSGLVDTLTVLVMAVYFAADLPRVRRKIDRLLLPHQRIKFEPIWDRVVHRVGRYVSGNLFVSGIAGVTSFVALTAIGVPFAAAVAFWVAITDLIPTIGAILGAAGALVIAALADGVSGGALIGLAVFFLLYQQIENFVIVPKVMTGAIDMSVAAVLIAILVGSELAGFIGVVVALPVAAAIMTVLDELVLEDRKAVVSASERRPILLRPWRRSAVTEA